VRLPAHHQVPLQVGWLPAAVLFGHRPLAAVPVGIVVMFVVSLAAFRLYIFTLPSDRGGGGQL
jgi:hypothetical protein